MEIDSPSFSPSSTFHCERDLYFSYCTFISQISKWVKDKMKIKHAAKKAHHQSFKLRPSSKYKEMYVVLLQKFKAAREEGYCVNFGWLWSKARTINKEQNGENTVVRKHVIATFIKRFNLRLRAKQRNRKHSKESFREGLTKWHGITREHLIRSGRDGSHDRKWGRFLPNQRYNVDQSPLPFAFTTKRTYKMIKKGDRYHKVWISQPGSGLGEGNVPYKFASTQLANNQSWLLSSAKKANVYPLKRKKHGIKILTCISKRTLGQTLIFLLLGQKKL